MSTAPDEALPSKVETSADGMVPGKVEAETSGVAAPAPTSSPAAAPAPAAPAAVQATQPAKPAVAAAKPAAAALAAKPAVKPAQPAKKPPQPAQKTEPAKVSTPQVDASAAFASAARDGAGAARAMRKKRARRLALGLALWVGLPFVLSVIYYGFVAQSEYESVAQFALRGSEPAQRGAMLREHMRSRETLEALDASAKFSQHYTHAGDPFTRLAKQAGSESRGNLFRHHVTVDHDGHTGIITLRVRAYRGDAAQKFASVITHEGERFLTRLTAGSRTRAAELANAPLREVEDRLVELERAEPSTNADQRALAVQKRLVEREFESALKSVEQARDALSHDEAPLIVVSSPSQPTEPSYPRRLYGIATVLVVSLLLFGVGSLLIAAVREHAQF